MNRKTASMLLVLGGALTLSGCVGYPVHGPSEVYGGAVYGKGYGYPSYFDDDWYYGGTYSYPYAYRPYGYSSYNYYNYYGSPYVVSRPAPSHGHAWNNDDHRRPPPGHVYRPGGGHNGDHDHDHDGGHGGPRPPQNRPPQNGGWAAIAKPIVKNPPGRSQSSPTQPRIERRGDNNPSRRAIPGQVVRERSPEPVRNLTPRPKVERPQRLERQQARAEHDDDSGRQRSR
jgi:hypothetical protein